MDFDFKVPSTVPQDLLLIQDLIGIHPPPTIVEDGVHDSPDFGDDSISSTDDEPESEDEVEAGLALRDDDSGNSVATSDSAWASDSEPDASSSGSEVEHRYAVLRSQRPLDDIVDEESGVTIAPTYLQTKNEIIDASIMIPTISEVAPCDTLEKVGDIMSIVGNIVIVKGLPVDHVNSMSERTLDAESLLVFDDRKVLGHVYETFGPTSQPLYQVKFNQHYPLDTDKVRLSREVFHVPQRSHFVFLDLLKNLRGSDASNIHDEEPADDEIEFSDDEKEAAFRAQHKKRRAHSESSSRQSPASSRVHIDDMGQDTYCGSNPYDAHGPYDDDYHVIGPSRPPPIPYDDPYADAPTPDARVRDMEMNRDSGGVPVCIHGGGPKAPRGRSPGQSMRGRGVRNHQSWGTSRQGHRHKPVASRRTSDPDMDQSFPAASRTNRYVTGRGQTGDTIEALHSPVQPTSNVWLSPEVNNIQGLGQPFIQPHINPRFASAFGLNLPSAPMVPWASQNINMHDHTASLYQWLNTWSMHSSTGSEGEGDSYRPM